MILTVPNLTKETRADLIGKINLWKGSKKLSMPNIYGCKPKGKRLEIEFHDSDSVKMVMLLRREGYSFE